MLATAMSHVSIETVIARDLHNLLYLAEFTFASNKFSPVGSSEVELADAVVALDDTLLVLQIKERSAAHAGNADAERLWFKKKILKDAKNQIRDTVRFLVSHDSIEIANEPGRMFNLSSSRYSSVVKIIVHHSSRELPDDCKCVRFCSSKEAGFIHIVSYGDYVQLSRFLRVPEEIIRYFGYRQQVLTEFVGQCGMLPEASIVGGFVGDEARPAFESYRNLHRTIDDEESWNLIPLLDGLHDHQTLEAYNDDYYRIL